MVDAAREQKIGGPKRVDAPGSEHVLGLDLLAASRGSEAGHHVGLAVDAGQAAVATATQAVRSAGSVQLRTARQGKPIGRDQRVGEGLTAFGDDAVPVVADLDRISRGFYPRGHGRWSLSRLPEPGAMESPSAREML